MAVKQADTTCFTAIRNSGISPDGKSRNPGSFRAPSRNCSLSQQTCGPPHLPDEIFAHQTPAAAWRSQFDQTGFEQTDCSAPAVRADHPDPPVRKIEHLTVAIFEAVRKRGPDHRSLPKRFAPIRFPSPRFQRSFSCAMR